MCVSSKRRECTSTQRRCLPRSGRERPNQRSQPAIWVYLIFLFFLPGTGGTVPPMLGLWSAYLVWLGAAVVATMRRDATELPLGQHA